MARALLAGPPPQVNRAALRVPRTSRTTPAMHEKFTRMTPALYDYLLAHAPPPVAGVCPGHRPSGVLVLDKHLWSGHVIDALDRSESAGAFRPLTDAVARDRRAEAVMWSVSDGIALVRKLEGGRPTGYDGSRPGS